MKELDQILRDHAKRYPLMQIADAVKLIYQNEFGGGHLIRDEEACLCYLRREYAAIEKDPAAERYEEIGNGIVRVNLAALEPEDLEKLGRDFITSAQQHKGTQERFLEKLEILRALTKEGVFSFRIEDLDAYLAVYASAGYPAVSHSDAYRKAYHPAYRVIVK